MSGWGSIYEHELTIENVDPKSRARCDCGCGKRGTHYGAANGMAMTSPMCELQARRWVKSPESAYNAAIRSRSVNIDKEDAK